MSRGNEEAPDSATVVVHNGTVYLSAGSLAITVRDAMTVPLQLAHALGIPIHAEVATAPSSTHVCSFSPGVGSRTATCVCGKSRWIQ